MHNTQPAVLPPEPRSIDYRPSTSRFVASTRESNYRLAELEMRTGILAARSPSFSQTGRKKDVRREGGSRLCQKTRLIRLLCSIPGEEAILVPQLCLIFGPAREDPYSDCVEASSLRDTEEEENEKEGEERKDGGVAFPAAAAA